MNAAEHVPVTPNEVTSITLAFADGHYRFWLPMKEACQLEKEAHQLGGEHGGSLMSLWSGLSEVIAIDPTKGPVLLPLRSTTLVSQVRAIIRLAAQGGNRRVVAGEVQPVSAVDATELVKDYVDDRPLMETFPVAWAILDAAVSGRPGTRPGDAAPTDPVDAQL